MEKTSESKLRPQTQVYELADDRCVDIISVAQGYCVTHQDQEGDKTAYYGGYTYTLDDESTRGILYVHPDPTAEDKNPEGTVVAVVQSEVTVEGGRRKMEMIIFFPDHFESILLTIKH